MPVRFPFLSSFDNLIQKHTAVYATDGRLNRTFLLNIKGALSNLAGLADDLNKSFPLRLEATDSGLSRVAAYLHLFYQQVGSSS